MEFFCDFLENFRFFENNIESEVFLWKLDYFHKWITLIDFAKEVLNFLVSNGFFLWLLWIFSDFLISCKKHRKICFSMFLKIDFMKFESSYGKFGIFKSFLCFSMFLWKISRFAFFITISKKHRIFNNFWNFIEKHRKLNLSFSKLESLGSSNIFVRNLESLGFSMFCFRKFYRNFHEQYFLMEILNSEI